MQILGYRFNLMACVFVAGRREEIEDGKNLAECVFVDYLHQRKAIGHLS